MVAIVVIVVLVVGLLARLPALAQLAQVPTRAIARVVKGLSQIGAFKVLCCCLASSRAL